MIVKKEDIAKTRPMNKGEKAIANFNGNSGFFVFVVDGGKQELSVKFWDNSIYDFINHKIQARDYIKSQIESRIFDNTLTMHTNETGDRLALSQLTEQELIKLGRRYWKNGNKIYTVWFKNTELETSYPIVKTDVELHYVGSKKSLNAYFEFQQINQIYDNMKVIIIGGED